MTIRRKVITLAHQAVPSRRQNGKAKIGLRFEKWPWRKRYACRPARRRGSPMDSGRPFAPSGPKAGRVVEDAGGSGTAPGGMGRLTSLAATCGGEAGASATRSAAAGDVARTPDCGAVTPGTSADVFGR